jgi:uncharacterized membrane protein YeaQ/YmgE (transglycosylase-associated protein family)
LQPARSSGWVACSDIGAMQGKSVLGWIYFRDDNVQGHSGRTQEHAMGLFWFLIVGLVAGWLAGVLVKGGGFGLVGDLVVGVLGAFLGGFLFGTFRISLGGGLLGSILVATIGAVVLLFVVRLIKRA